MNLLYFSFFIFCFVTLGQLAGYFVLVDQIPDNDEMKENRDKLKEKANQFILPYYSINLCLILILFICKSMNSTKWWFMFWTILLGLFPAGLALYIIIKYDYIKDELEEICKCKVKLERHPDTRELIKCPEDEKYKNKDDVEKYCDKLTLGLLLVSIFQLIAFTFYFISLYNNHDFRKIQPDVIYIPQPTEPIINTTTNSPQNNRMNSPQNNRMNNSQKK